MNEGMTTKSGINLPNVKGWYVWCWLSNR